jgi:hypothetical protein
MRDEGSTIPLILVLLMVAISFVAVAAAATSLHLERLRLLTVADGAALAGAESFAVADVHVRNGTVVPTLRDSRVLAAARAYLGDVDAGRFEGLRLIGADGSDGATAEVTVTAVWRPPLVNALLPLSIPVTVSSTAAARFR